MATDENKTQPNDLSRRDVLKSASVHSSRLIGFCLLVACTGFFPTSQARAYDLTGSWATNTDQCEKIFVKKGDEVTFTQYSDEFGGGFVADAKQIRTKGLRCSIKSRKETGDTIDIQAACASDIMTSSMQLRLKFLDDNSVYRINPDPDMAGMQMTFHRCAK